MDVDERRRKLEAAGLVVLDAVWDEPGADPMSAWRPMITGADTPHIALRIQEQSGHCQELDSEWEGLAQRIGVFGASGEFLISVAGEGANSIGWARVRRTDGMRLAWHLGDHRGEPEFAALSLDGRVGCGMTTEEYDVRVVASPQL